MRSQTDTRRDISLGRRPIGGPYSVEIDTVADHVWDRVAGEFADIHHEQTACYAGLHWKGRDSHVLVWREDVPVAGARVALVKLPLIDRGLAYLRFGPFWRRREQKADAEIYRTMIQALIEEYCGRRGHCLSVLARPHPDYHALEGGWLGDMGFVKRRDYEDPERYLVNTALDTKAQSNSLAQKWRYNLRQALANSLDIRLSEYPAEAEAFQALYASMMERKEFSSTTPVHLTGQLIAQLPDSLKPKLFVAYHEKRLVAGATVGVFGDTAYYMFGASSGEALPLKAGYALHWFIVQWLYEKGIASYDLGGASHEPGLRQFKKGFVGKEGKILVMEGEQDRWTSTLGKMSADIIFGARHLRRRIRHGAKFGKASERSS
jgi:hypothetical protein